MGKSDVNDPRNMLLARFFEYVAYFEPKFFMMENVPGLGAAANLKVLKKAMEVLPDHYVVLPPLLLDAADFGAATSRPRLIVIGYDPEHCDSISAAEISAPSVKSRATVRDAISDLPNPPDQGDWLKVNRKPNTYATSLMSWDNYEVSTFGQERLGQGLISGFQKTRHTATVVERFSKLQQGERDPISKYQRLSWDRPSHVLRAGTGSDRGSFQAARPVHPAEPRVISVREAARIQGFPDWFQFHETKWHSHRMIGNSVSPPFAKAILSRLVHACHRRDEMIAAE